MKKTGFVAPLEIGFCVSDIDRSLLFWRDALGLVFVAHNQVSEQLARQGGIALSGYDVVRLQLPMGERIKLFSLQATKAAAGKPATGLPLDSIGLAFVTLIVNDIRTTVARLDAAGFPCRQAPCELRPGLTMTLVNDPDGNIVELAEYADLASYRPDLTGCGKRLFP